MGSRVNKQIIRYWWKRGNGERIEMCGSFTPERWEQFCKQSHPSCRNVTITRMAASKVLERGRE